MFIKQILASKGSRVVTTQPDATIAEVATLLKRERIGAVIVSDATGELCGIISERDLARGLADHGAGLLDLRVEEMMTAEVITCTPNDSLETLMQEMTARRFRHLPVLEAGKVVGIISIGDVVKHRLQELEKETNLLQDYIVGA